MKESEERTLLREIQAKIAIFLYTPTTPSLTYCDGLLRAAEICGETSSDSEVQRVRDAIEAEADKVKGEG